MKPIPEEPDRRAQPPLWAQVRGWAIALTSVAMPIGLLDKEALTRRLAWCLLPVGAVTALAGLGLVVVPGAASAVSMLPPCEAGQLSLTLDDSQQGPDSEARSGTRLVVRNRSTSGCRIPGLPPVIFRDASGQTLPIERQIPPGMHPGPVVLPASLPPGVSLSARLEWDPTGTSTGGRCYSPTTIEMTIGGQAITQSFQGSLCASPGQPAMFMQTWFRWRAIMGMTQ